MTDNQVTFSFKTLIFTAIILLPLFNNYVTGDHYNDITSQVRVPLLCDDGEIDWVCTSWMSRRTVSEPAVKFYMKSALVITPPTLENEKMFGGVPVFLFAARPGSRKCLLGTYSHDFLKRT